MADKLEDMGQKDFSLDSCSPKPNQDVWNREIMWEFIQEYCDNCLNKGTISDPCPSYASMRLAYDSHRTHWNTKHQGPLHERINEKEKKEVACSRYSPKENPE